MFPIELIVLVEGKMFPQYSSSAAMIRINREKINLLFDMGSPYDKSLIARKLAQANVKTADIHYIISSHWHMDHIGSIDLFKNAKLIVSAETLHTQRNLLEAVLMVEKSSAPVEALTEVLFNHFTNEQTIEQYLPKLRAMANITIQNAYLLKKFVEKSYKDQVIMIEHDEQVLFNAVGITKLSFHTEGDLVVQIVNQNDENVFLMGDVIVSPHLDLEKLLNFENHKWREKLGNNYILPGHSGLCLFK